MGKTLIKGKVTTHTEYELRIARRSDPCCYSAYPCDEHGNLYMKDADKWGKSFLREMNSDDYGEPKLASCTVTRKEPDLNLCSCGKLYLATADYHGKVTCPECSRVFGTPGARKKTVDRKGFYVVRKEVAG